MQTIIVGLRPNIVIIDECFKDGYGIGIAGIRSPEYKAYKVKRKQNNDWRKKGRSFQGFQNTGV